MKVNRIFLSHDDEQDDLPNKDNADVIVALENGEKYIASFFTYDNIKAIRDRHRKTGEYLSGKYFWTKYMVLVESCELMAVEEIVNFLIDEGDFKDVFRLLTSNPANEN